MVLSEEKKIGKKAELVGSLSHSQKSQAEGGLLREAHRTNGKDMRHRVNRGIGKKRKDQVIWKWSAIKKKNLKKAL